MTPEQDRINERSTVAGNPAIANLRSVLSSGKKDVEDGFLRWRRDGFTRLFTSALRELVDNPPYPSRGDVDVNQVLVQTGMTLGLSMALKLFTQPKRLFPEVFGGSTRPAEEVSELTDAYIDTPDDIIDNM